MRTLLSNFITFTSVLAVVIPPAIANILAYPLSKKLCLAVSHYIRFTCSRLVFAVLHTYKHFDLVSYKENQEQLPDQFIIMSNHQSLMDIPLYMRFLPETQLRFVAKDELSRHIPLVSEMLRAEEHCMVPRHGSPSVAMRTIDSFGKRVVERSQVPVIFPEGTRSKDGTLGTFYAAGFRRLCDATNLPVAVCALDGGWKINNMKTFFKNLHHGSYKVKVLKVYPAPHGKEEQAAILAEGKELIQHQLDEWRK